MFSEKLILLLIAQKYLFIQFITFIIQNQMGSSQSTKNLLESYNIQSTLNGLKVLSKKHNKSQKYILKSYNTTSLEQHTKKLEYFRSYKTKMSQNMQITKLVEVYEERQQTFCMHTFKIHLLFQYSFINLSSLVQTRKPKKEHKDSAEYFKYQDLCNILYSCLSALWIVQQVGSVGLDSQLKQFNTIFLATENIIIFQDGSIKIMDPYLIGYEKRYVFSQNVNYSPEKLKDFYGIDDEKSAIFQLGMTLLQVCLLQSMKSAYSGFDFNQEVVKKKLYKARQLYSVDLQKNLGVNLFDIIEKLTLKDRKNRLSLQQVIYYAEKMYEKQDQCPQTGQINQTIKKCVTSSAKEKQLKLTNHTSSGKKTSPSLQKFYDYRDSIVYDKLNDAKFYLENSPKISNFTIQEVPLQKEQSSMIQSFKVQNTANQNILSQSLLNGGIFSTLKLNDSYNYAIFDKKPKQQQIFTEPLLLQAINRELQEIEMRKLRRSNYLQQSQTLQRKDRYQIQSQYKIISNQAYLIE